MKYIHYFETTEKQNEQYNGYTQKEESGTEAIIDETNVKFTSSIEDEELSNTTELPLSVSSEGSSSLPEEPPYVEYKFSPSQDILKKLEDNIEKYGSIHMMIECGEYSNEFDITKEDINPSSEDLPFGASAGPSTPIVRPPFRTRPIFGLANKENIWSEDNQFKPILEIGGRTPKCHIIILGVADTSYTSNVNITYSYNGIIEEPNYKEPYIDYDDEAKLLHYNKALDFANTVETDESHNIIPIVFIGGDGYDDNGSRVEFDYTDIIDHIMIDDELVNLNSLKSYHTGFTSTNEDSGVYGMVEASKYYLGIKAEPGYHTIKYFLKNITESPMVLGANISPLQTI